MSHNIQKHDTCVSLQKEWHNLQTIVQEITPENSGLDWTVARETIVLEKNGQKIDTHYAVFCEQKNHVIQIAKESYTLIQNSQLFEILDQALTGVPYDIVAAVSLGNLSKVAITVALREQQEYLVNGEHFKNFLTIATSHDTSQKLEFWDTSIKSICQNTLQWSRANRDGILNVSVMHTKNCQVKIDSMKDKIEQLFEKRLEFYETYEGLMARPMTLDQAEKILVGFEAKDELSTRTKNKVDEIVGLFQSGKGNSGATVSDLFNGYTEYFTSKSSDNLAKAWASSEFGSGRDKKLAFWEAVISDSTLTKLADRGEKLLSLV